MRRSSSISFLSHAINRNTPLYGGRTDIVIEKDKSLAMGDSCNAMRWSLPNHVGTHLDAPLHFVDNGKCISDIRAEECFFEHSALVRLENIEAGKIISATDLPVIDVETELLLIKTEFEKYRGLSVYWQNSPALSPDLAEHLADLCPALRVIGIDFISISNINNRELGREAHRQFLGRGISLLEDMHLAELTSAPREVIVAPLLVEKADASPCTVLAVN